MRRTTCGQWVHATCALWTPGTWINCDTGLVEGLSKLSKVWCPQQMMHQPRLVKFVAQLQVVRTGCEVKRSWLWP